MKKTKLRVALILLLFYTLSSKGQSIITIVKEGITFTLMPSFELKDMGGGNLFGSRNFQVTLHDINASQNGTIVVDGRTYTYQSFGGLLQPYFDQVSVYAIDATVYINGLKDCPTISTLVWKPGRSETRFCEPLKDATATIQSVSVSEIAYHGIYQLRSKIYELLREEEAQKLKQQKINGLLNDGDSYFQGGRYQDAISKYSEVLRMDPENAQAFQQKSQAEAQLERTKAEEKKVQDENKPENTEGTSDGNQAQNESSEETQESADTSTDANSGSTIDYSASISLAVNYEIEGDQLLQQGNIQGALEKYNLAQAAFYSEDRAKKIQELSLQQAAAVIAMGIVNASEKIDAAEESADPEGVFRYWKFIGLNYETSLSKSFAQPALDIQWSFLVLAVGLKFGYLTNAMQEYRVYIEGYQNAPIRDAVQLESKGINMEFSLGGNIPIKKHVNIRPMYGFTVLSAVDDFSVRPDKGFSLKQGQFLNIDEHKLSRYSLGIYYHFPKTKVGAGVKLSYVTQKPFDINSGEIKLTYFGKDPNYKGNSFSIDKPLESNFTAFAADFSLIFGLARR
jgi:tetratricopeptide (TPR) repeat protein